MLLKGTYFKERTSLHKILDILGAIGLLAIAVALVWILLPKHTPDLIVVDANIAPKEVITGGSSTLTFRYENQSKEELENVRLRFEFPKYFLLDSYESLDAQEIAQQEFDLGSVASTQYGFIHVHGTMFGDVGGEQTFITVLSYNYGNEGELYDEKRIEHTFSPTASTLSLNLELPDHLVARQEVHGSITYTNTGDVDFPDLSIEPQWPENFELVESNVALTDGQFHVTPIPAGETGVIEFIGVLGTEVDTTFSFIPSFRFGPDLFAQEPLVDTIEILPPPLTVRHSIQNTSLEPGGRLSIELTYENADDLTVSDVQLRVEADPGILDTTGIENGSYSDGYYLFDAPSNIEPGQSDTIVMTIPVRRSFSRSQLNELSHISLGTQSSATFVFEVDGEEVASNTFGNTDDIHVSSPIALQSFARYYAPTGDQLGRGPLPPYVGETTKYWIFWNISGTTNELSGIQIEADLGPGVVLTGRQSVSVGSAVSQSGNTISWSLGSINPTLPSGSTVVGAAFEVAITPTESQIGTTPTLIGPARITAKDEFTGAFVTGSAAGVTTTLYNDAKGAAYGSAVEF